MATNSGKIDFELAARLGLQHFRAWLPPGVQKGREYVTTNPTRDDRKARSFSVNTETGVWADFATGDKGGDAVDLYAYLHKIKNGEAAREILSKYSASFAGATPAPAPAPEWSPLVPVPDDAPAFACVHPVYEAPSKVWLYTTETGQRVFQVARYETGEGKEIIPWSYCLHSDGREQWRQRRPPSALPLYNLVRLCREPLAPVLIVEGEKAADAAQAILAGWVVVTWHGGVNAVGKTNWQSLAGRDCVLWPDADRKKDKTTGQELPPEKQPGAKAMAEIHSILKGIAPARIIKTPPGKPDGWDVADAVEEGWTEADVLQLLKKPADPSALPFRALGYDHDTLYFMSGRTFQVLSFTASQLSKRSLCTLAPLSDWEREFPSRSHGPDWDAAADAIIQQCVAAGPYDKRRLRGRGAWWDSGRVVLHLGDRLLADGRAVPLHEIHSPFVYEHRPAIGSPDASAASTEEAARLLAMLRRYNWETPLDAYFLAGWAVVAPICGALSWRPHLWLTGPSGSGKSYVQTQIVRPLLGNQSIIALGKSSEAGIRQELAGDALPVVIDEAEGHDQRARENVKNLLFLARGASSEGEANTFRGTIAGKAQRFDVRSCFLFSSIGVGIDDGADESRVTVVSLRPDRNAGRAERWASLKADSEALFTGQYCDAIRARTIALIPVLRDNARTFGRAAADVLGNQRIGDQIGILLAGAYSLTSDARIEEEAAREWIEARKAQLQAQRESQETKDEEIVLQTILTSQVRVSDSDRTQEITVGELVQRAAGKSIGPVRLSVEDADVALKRLGLRVDMRREALFVANKHDGVRRLLRETPWASNYDRMLKRLEFAQTSDAIRFGPGVKQRCTGLPLKCVLPEDAPEETEDFFGPG